MKAVDQRHEPLRVAIAGGGGEVSRHLVAPGSVEGVLHHRQELHVRVAHVPHIGDQRVGDLLISEHPPVVGPPPGAQVHLVDVQGQGVGVPLRPGRHPVRVPPHIAVQVAEPGGGVGPLLHLKAVRVGPVVPGAVGPLDGILVSLDLLRRVGIGVAGRIGRGVEGGGLHLAHPDAVLLPPHRASAPVPAAELADQGDRPGIGRPEGEAPHGLFARAGRVRAQHPVSIPAGPTMKGRPFLRRRRCVLHNHTSFRPSSFITKRHCAQGVHSKRCVRGRVLISMPLF